MMPLLDKWVPVTTAWRVLRMRMEVGPSDVEGKSKVIPLQARCGPEGG